MRRAAALLLAVALLALSGCGPAGPKAVNPGVSGTATDQGLELKASVAAATFNAGAVPVVEVEVRNTGKTAVRYVRFNGCDKGFQVRMQPAAGHFVEKSGSPVVGCTEAVEFADLQPGASVKAVYEFRTGSGEPELVPGQHVVAVSFNRGAGPDSLQPVVVNLKVKVTSR